MPVAQVREPGGPYRLVVEGQSLCNRPVGDAFPVQLMSGRGHPWSVSAIDGFPWAFLTLDADERLWPLFALNDETDVVFCGGQGDISGIFGLLPAATGAVVYSRLVTMAEDARANGATRVYAMTMPRGPALFGADGSALNVQREAHNTLLLDHAATDPGVFDGVIDIGNPSLADGLHPDSDGAAAMAALTAAFVVPNMP